jgi:hypothetical protein
MREAHEGRVEWPDTSPDTFVRFAKFAYSGDYTEAEHDIINLGESSAASKDKAATKDKDKAKARTKPVHASDQTANRLQPLAAAHDDDGESESGGTETSFDQAEDDMHHHQHPHHYELEDGGSSIISTSDDLDVEFDEDEDEADDDDDVYDTDGTDETDETDDTDGNDDYGGENMERFHALPFDLATFIRCDKRHRSRLRYEHLERFHQPPANYHRPPKRRRTEHHDDDLCDFGAAIGCSYYGPPDPRGDAIRRFESFLRDHAVAPSDGDGGGDAAHSTASGSTLTASPTSFSLSTPKLAAKSHSHSHSNSHPKASAPQDSWEPRLNSDVSESFEPVFLSHANLYVLADKYAVEDLRQLTLGRLHKTLLNFFIHPERVSDLVVLTDALFENTAEGDVARAMLVGYWVCILEHVSAIDEFKDLTRKHGDFAAMLFEKITPRLL